MWETSQGRIIKPVCVLTVCTFNFTVNMHFDWKRNTMFIRKQSLFLIPVWHQKDGLPFANDVKRKSKWQRLSQLFSRVHISRTVQRLWAFECFWHGSSRRGREPNNCCDIPNGLIPFNFSVFLLPPDPDHILPHCGEGDILQWGWEIQSPNCWRRQRQAGCKLWSDRLKAKKHSAVF